jgi:hypothetical protein
MDIYGGDYRVIREQGGALETGLCLELEKVRNGELK